MSDKVTTREMLKELDFWRDELLIDTPRIQAIRALILASDKRPGVDGGFLREWYDELYSAAREKRWGEMRKRMEAMLQEAGVKIKGPPMTEPSVSEKEMLDCFANLREMAERDLGATATGLRKLDAIRAAILEHGRLMKAIEADQQALMAAEKLAIEFLRLKKKVGELGKRAKGILANPDLMDDPDIFEFIKDIRDSGEEAGREK